MMRTRPQRPDRPWPRPIRAGAEACAAPRRAELHEVRATLEAHVKRARIADPEGAEGCGLFIGPNMSPVLLRATAGGVVTTYEIDRWD